MRRCVTGAQASLLALLAWSVGVACSTAPRKLSGEQTQVQRPAATVGHVFQDAGVADVPFPAADEPQGPTPAEQKRLASLAAWSKPCAAIVRGLDAELLSSCPGAKVQVETGDQYVRAEALDSRARCGLRIEVDSYNPHERKPGWHREPYASLNLGPGFFVYRAHAVTRTAFGLEAHVIVVPAGPGRQRDALLASGRRIADGCLAAADDGYRKYRLVLDGPEQRQGKCIVDFEDAKRDPLRTLEIHWRPRVIVFADNARELLPQDSGPWIVEREFGLLGPLHGCGPLVDCAHDLGARKEHWNLSMTDGELTGEYTRVDRGLQDLDKGGDAFACRVVVRFHGHEVPQ